MTTTDLSQFGARELEMAAEILTAYSENNITPLAEEYFSREGVTVMNNFSSGNVFLTNNEYEVLMMNGDVLDLWINLPYSGDEGFIEDFDIDDYEGDDFEYLDQLIRLVAN